MSAHHDWAELPEWMFPPRPEGWIADDLDRLPDTPYHVELIDGALVFMMSPQRVWHFQMIYQLVHGLKQCAPDELRVQAELPVRLDARTRLQPDVLIVDAPYEPNRTGYDAADVVLVVEVVSPESAHRDQHVKINKYAQAGIPHYWRIEEERGTPVIHRYELDEATRQYVPVGIDAGVISCSRPFEITIDLTDESSR